jgi:hypothetical protein
MNTLKTMTAAAALMLAAGAAHAQTVLTPPPTQDFDWSACIDAAILAHREDTLTMTRRCGAEQSRVRQANMEAARAYNDAVLARQLEAKREQEIEIARRRAEQQQADARRAQDEQEKQAQRKIEQEQQAAINAQRVEQQQIANAEREKTYRAAIAKAEADQEARGYKAMAFDDFVLDGQKLAASEAKVAVHGLYKKIGQMSWFFPDAISTMRGNPKVRIALLTDDATRETRQFFLASDRDIANRGSEITLLGHATTCTITHLAGSQNEPCIEVEDGWNVVKSVPKE